MSKFETEKLYYSISEVSKITDVPHYLIRKWENSFVKLKPSRNTKGNRVYTSKDVSVLLAIKKLTKEQGYTIEKAKDIIDSGEDLKIDQNEVKNQIKTQNANTAIPKVVSEQKEILLEIRQLALEGLDLLKELESVSNVDDLFDSLNKLISNYDKKHII